MSNSLFRVQPSSKKIFLATLRCFSIQTLSLSFATEQELDRSMLALSALSVRALLPTSSNTLIGLSVPGSFECPLGTHISCQFLPHHQEPVCVPTRHFSRICHPRFFLLVTQFSSPNSFCPKLSGFHEERQGGGTLFPAAAAICLLNSNLSIEDIPTAWIPQALAGIIHARSSFLTPTFK